MRTTTTENVKRNDGKDKQKINGKKAAPVLDSGVFTGCIKPHSEVMAGLLSEIQPVNFRDYLGLPEDEDVKQKHIVVAIVKKLLETATENNWNLCKAFEYIYVYNGAFWHQLEKEDVKKFLGDCAVNMGCPDYDARHYEFKDKLLKQFLTDAHLPQPQPEENKILINLQNGTMEFTGNGWNLRPFSALDFLTYQLPFAHNAGAACPLFNNYLLTVLPDESSRTLLQEFAGYIFTNLNLEKMLMLTGGGANGKSVFFNVITALLGKQNVLTYSLGMFNHEYYRTKLTNVLLNYSSEKGTEINPDIFKALVSSEPLPAREPYGKPFTLYNRVRFIINANELPKETEQTEAYFRRWLIIPFDVTIPEHERDTELANKIIKAELAGVFNWLLQGLERIVKNKKFSQCQKADKAVDEFRRQSDSVSLYIEENGYKPSAMNTETVKDLYNQYKAFCIDDGYKPAGKNKFSMRLEKKGFVRTRLAGGTAAFCIIKG